MADASHALLQFAAEAQRRFDSLTTAAERKERGHFGTPPAIAFYMAEMFARVPERQVRILDPGAGVGTLSAAVCLRLLRCRSPRRVCLEAWENDPQLIPFLRSTLNECRRVLQTAGHELQYAIRAEDFILAQSAHALFDEGPRASFDWTILNPPYFKVPKDGPHARTMRHVVHGQPNIYALFLAAAAELLTAQGELVAITPRSYFSGPYFERFRTWFFARVAARRIHLFDSRREAFKEGDVLQENVILHAQKSAPGDAVVLSTSAGRSFASVALSAAPYDVVVGPPSAGRVVRLPGSDRELDVVAALDELPTRLHDLGWEISTGPVVSFRAADFLRRTRGADTAPLLWLHNVRPFTTRFPIQEKKPAHLVVSQESRKLLVPAQRYVLLKRFTAKEEKRRLVAGIVSEQDSYSDWLGLENHLNYIHRRGAGLPERQALGLAAYYNSGLVDRYFRIHSGNTQVNAAEIRGLPLPDEEQLDAIGRELLHGGVDDADAVELVVAQAVRFPRDLLREFAQSGP